ncbi:Spondin-1 F-spondin, partial [Takifugu flavidus]
MPPSGRHSRLALLLCLVSTAACNLSGFTEEPFERVGKSDGYCSRILRAQSNRKEVNNEFRLRVEGDPENYQPGSTYRVTLTASSPAYFRGFILVALREGAEGDRDEDYTGNFQIIDEEDTQFMTNCPPAVTESTPRRRTSIQVYWTAPPAGSGCILLKYAPLGPSVLNRQQKEALRQLNLETPPSARASIVQKRIIYFQDEGSLTKRMCEKESLYRDSTDKPLLDCCACGTAKYRVTFYGNWSEKTHPKDYPRKHSLIVSADGQEVTERSSLRIGGGKSPSRSVVVNKPAEGGGFPFGSRPVGEPPSLLLCGSSHLVTVLANQKSIFPGRANHWSAIIGASHSKNYVVWEYGGYASDGVKQVAELGSPVKMEEEIRQK